MQLYSTKQVVGGFILVILFVLVFIVNAMKRDLKPLLTPVLVGLTISLLVYVIILNDVITSKKKLLKSEDKFELKTCPASYNKTMNFDGDITEIHCLDSSKSVPSFYLQGNENVCKNELVESNGCFNKISSRKQKCDNITNFFKTDTDTNGTILKNWSEYQNNCVV